jgi:hypothetical protein
MACAGLQNGRCYNCEVGVGDVQVCQCGVLTCESEFEQRATVAFRVGEIATLHSLNKLSIVGHLD